MSSVANAASDESRPRSPLGLVLLAGLVLVLFAGFIALGTWQVHRRAWKLDLIQRVDQRVHAAPEVPPGTADWLRIGKDDEYRRVRIEGRYLDKPSVKVKAVTERGPGFWVITPMRAREGFIVMINRGFVETDQLVAAPNAEDVAVTGLLRLSEPKGGFLHRNDPVAGRWYSRDVAAIAAAENLDADRVAPYFIDAEAVPNAPADQPVGGLTVIRFHNSHLVYAVTWYALALMVAFAAVVVGRQEWRLRSQPVFLTR
jgi:surfeit locus 1 family protein